MNNTRLIAKLDVKGENLVKGIKFEGLRKLGHPNDFAHRYYLEGVDEIIYLDIVASLYERNNLKDIIYETTQNIFVPITVGGGIRSLDDVKKVLDSGADKVAINTAALKDPSIITQVSEKFGAQCMVLSIQAKRIGDNKWEAYYDCGRERSGIDVVEWVKKGYDLGAGEILITSVDKEGTQSGIDGDLIKAVSTIVPIPVIYCGGVSSPQDFVDAVVECKADAVAVASVLHYGKTTIGDIKKIASHQGLDMR